MRLFTAINFDEAAKQRLTEITGSLQAITPDGRFTRPQNLHLTLVFLGEIPQSGLRDIMMAMDKVQEPAFSLELLGLGSFRQDSGELLWMGATKSRALMSVYDQLRERLSQTGIPVELREFKPHLTLARELTLPGDFDRSRFADEAGTVRTQVKSIDLMKSERVNGAVKYSRVYAKQL